MRRGGWCSVAGGIPLGQRTCIPVVTGASAQEPARIVRDAGRRCLEIEIAPTALVTTTRRDRLRIAVNRSRRS